MREKTVSYFIFSGLRLPLIYRAACGFASRHSRLWVSLERKITELAEVNDISSTLNVLLKRGGV